jgi:hypothetical protein
MTIAICTARAAAAIINISFAGEAGNCKEPVGYRGLSSARERGGNKKEAHRQDQVHSEQLHAL